MQISDEVDRHVRGCCKHPEEFLSNF